MLSTILRPQTKEQSTGAIPAEVSAQSYGHAGPDRS
jgi:hypothetical protein